MGLAEFLDDLAEEDLVQEKQWRALSKKYEVLAFEEVSKVESLSSFFNFNEIDHNIHNYAGIIYYTFC